MRTCGAVVLALLPLLSAGCVSLDRICGGEDRPPCGAVHQVVVTWNNELMYAADPVHGGELIPGIGGRLYLFGPQIDFPLEGDGTVMVDLYDETGPSPSGVPLERWNFDGGTLKRLLRRDMIGWGYTVFLRWSTYRPEVTQVRLKVCYQPKKGTPLYAESAVMTLNSKEANAKGPPVAKKPGEGPGGGLPPKPVAPAGVKAPGVGAWMPAGEPPMPAAASAGSPSGPPEPWKS